MKLSALAAVLGLGCTPAGPEPAPQAQAGAGGSPTATGGSSSGTTSSAAGSGTLAGGSAGAPATNGGAAGAAAGGAAAGAAGNTAAGAAGAANSGGGSGDYCKARDGLTFCETFEAQPVGPAQAKPPWAPAVNGAGTVTIDDSVVHAGQHSLKVHGADFSTFLVLSGAPLPANAGRLHVRMFVRLAEAMTGGHNTFLVADMAAAPGAGNAFRLGEMNAMLMYTVSGDTHGALANEKFYTDHLPGAALTAASWGCVEVALDHAKPEVQVWLDGKEIPDLHHTDWAVDGYDTLRFGFEKYAGPVSDVWYDDIAIGTAPLGCD